MDAFGFLGLTADARPEDIRAAFRRLALETHPDTGGDNESMAVLVAAYREALRSAADRGPLKDAARTGRTERDIASFTVDELPVVTFEGLLLVASAVGDIADEDPPYMVEFVIRDGGGVWCRCDVVPDAGGSTVSVTVDPVGPETLLDCERVRDILVAELNEIDWGSTGRV